MRDIVLIVHNVRSSYNVGSLLRTAEGLGVKEALLTGFTPYPAYEGDKRLPHIASKTAQAIHKTALGAETLIPWRQFDDAAIAIKQLKRGGYQIWAVEQSPASTKLPKFMPPLKCALVVGREVEGIEPGILAITDGIVEIPMLGSKESFNVAVAAAIVLYHCRFTNML